jgi:hypothetical protein
VRLRAELAIFQGLYWDLSARRQNLNLVLKDCRGPAINTIRLEINRGWSFLVLSVDV